MVNLVLRRGHLTFPRLSRPPFKFQLQENLHNNVELKVEVKVEEIPGKSSKVRPKRKREENKENNFGEVTKPFDGVKSKVKANKKEEKVGGKNRKKEISPDFDTRYFCPSCCCFVDASRRRHDMSIHKPPRMAIFRKSPPKMDPVPSVFCDLCEKECLTQKSLDLHKKRFHEKMKNEGTESRQLAPKIRLKMKLECFECNSFVPRKDYINHLKAHDRKAKKADTVNVQGPAKGNPFRSINAVREEYMTRRFVYQNPEDPRWNGDDAILQCRHCPKSLFWTWSKFEKHVRNMHPYVPGYAGENLPVHN